MLKRIGTLAMVIAFPTVLAATTFDGKWRASIWRSPGGAEIILIDGKGSLTFYGPAKLDNPCLNRPLPAILKSVSDAEVLIGVDGSSVLRGCFTGTLVLQAGTGGTWTSTLPTGLTATWTRE